VGNLFCGEWKYVVIKEYYVGRLFSTGSNIIKFNVNRLQITSYIRGIKRHIRFILGLAKVEICEFLTHSPRRTNLVRAVFICGICQRTVPDVAYDGASLTLGFTFDYNRI
jgi:hypothetical protein